MLRCFVVHSPMQLNTNTIQNARAYEWGALTVVANTQKTYVNFISVAAVAELRFVLVEEVLRRIHHDIARLTRVTHRLTIRI